MPRDNLLNSACLELFELIKRENIKPLITHLVETHRDRLSQITYVDTFQNLVLRYDQMQGYTSADPDTNAAPDGDHPTRSSGTKINGHQRWQGLKEDAAEEAYFNTSDDEDELSAAEASKKLHPHPTNGASPLLKSLVDYPDDDLEDPMDTSLPPSKPYKLSDPSTSETSPPSSRPPLHSAAHSHSPPERLSEKRRRQEDADDDDALVKLSQPKRRTSSMSSASSTGSNGVLRRKKAFSDRAREPGTKKIEISFGGQKKEREGDGEG